MVTSTMAMAAMSLAAMSLAAMLSATIWISLGSSPRPLGTATSCRWMVGPEGILARNLWILCQHNNLGLGISPCLPVKAFLIWLRKSAV